MRFTRIALAATAAVLAVASVPAHAGSDYIAPSATQDIARPKWAASVSGVSGVDCSHSSWNIHWPSGCRFRVLTPTSGAGCADEKIGNPSYPAVLFLNTTCSAWVDGKLTMTKVNGICSMTSVNTLPWSFSSGVAAIYNGSFNSVGINNNMLSATAKPLDTVGASYSLVLTGGGIADTGSPATAGSAYLPFKLNFSPRLPIGACPNPDLLAKGTVTAIQSDIDGTPIGQILMTS